MALLWAIQGNFTTKWLLAILFYGQIWFPSQGFSLYTCQAKWMYSVHVYGVNWSVESSRLSSLSVCLSTQVLQIQGVFSVLNTLQTVQNVGKTALYVIRFARYTRQMLKSLWVSIMGTPIDYTQIVGHVLNVQPETTVSVFRGFTLQHAFVRQWFVLCTCIATWHMGHMLYIASYPGCVGGEKNGLVLTACVCAAWVWG